MPIYKPASERGSDFASKLRTIKRLSRAVYNMQTYIEKTLMDSGYNRDAAKAEVERLKKRDNVDETQLALIIHSQVYVDLYPGLSEEEKMLLLPARYLKFKREHEGRVKQLLDLLKSLTPQQMKIVKAMSRKHLLYQERKKKKEKN